YAGETVKFDYTNYDVSTESGFNYLYNIRRDNRPSEKYSVDWKVKDTWNVNPAPAPEDIHLRMTMLTAVDEVSLADGQPPQNKPGNPDHYTYVLARRGGEDLQSQFVTVLEAYKDKRDIKEISRIPVVDENGQDGGTDVFAVKVTLADGRTDYIFSALDSEKLYV